MKKKLTRKESCAPPCKALLPGVRPIWVATIYDAGGTHSIYPPGTGHWAIYHQAPVSFTRHLSTRQRAARHRSTRHRATYHWSTSTVRPGTSQPGTGQHITGQPGTSQPATGQPVTGHLIPVTGHQSPVIQALVIMR